MMSVGAGDVRAAPVVADPAAVMRPGNARMSRLDAIAIARSTPSVQLTAELRRVAVDASDDAIVRATAIAVLAERGETVTVENNPPPAVVSALKKAGRIVATQRLVASFEQGQ